MFLEQKKKKERRNPLETMYPKVKVRSQEDEDDDFRLQEEKNSLMLLKVFESLALKVHNSPGKEYQTGTPPSVARISKLYSPNLAASSVSSSKVGAQKNVKQPEEDAKNNIRASSVPRPRAVLSNPDNDRMIGHINQLTRERPSVSQKNALLEKPRAQSTPRCVKARNSINTRQDPKELTDSNPRCVKARNSINTRQDPKEPTDSNPRCVKARNPINTRRDPKEPTDSNTYLKTMQSPELTVPKQKACLRKAKASTYEKLRTH